MEEKFVNYNGVKIIEGWSDKIEAAQHIETYKIGGKEFQLIRYGEESMDYGSNEHPCGDCAVIKGQLHVPFVCDVEQCPSCGEQSITCNCDYNDELSAA